jgi:hypothetical protein
VTTTNVVAFFCDDFAEKKKKTTIASITFFDGFVVKKGDGNYCRFFQWFCYEQGDDSNVVTFFYGDGVVKKVIASCHRFLSFFFFLLWSFWSSSLKLTINNEMCEFFLMLKVVMARGRKLKKGGGDLES